ncbi:uncharacterized protein PAC_19428 [Phialocephala subalpina]|uniref:Uncharacterized protein n=1 Tax=Phialocephala subalpina TaxID=576137 RepID=A0A1L7XWZ6_9HELO|nr:uncharacterized protein PAC_19428 [Phialocephala subalpina]
MVWLSPIKKRSRHPEIYLGPSFSWCSLLGRVEWPPIEHEVPRITILDIYCKLKGLDPTGEVQSCAIKVRGRLATAHLVHKGDGTGSDSTQSFGLERADGTRVDCSIDAQEDYPRSRFYDPDSGMDARSEEHSLVYCLVVLQDSRRDAGECCALIAVPSANERSTFERIGIVYAAKQNFWDDSSSIVSQPGDKVLGA